MNTQDRVNLGSLAVELAALGEITMLGGASAGPFAVHGVRPALLCVPPSAEALAACLARCREAGAAAIPWGGGTQQRLGLPPRAADVVISTAGLNRLVEHEPGDLTVTVETGMPLEELQRRLGAHGQWLPLDPPLQPGATLGGVIATNSSGPRRIKDGGPRDLVIGTRVANVDGTVTRAGGRVVKNVTGYDLSKAHIGALGTLGVLVEVSLKVAPRPQTERSWLATFPEPEAAGEAMSALSRLPLAPTALDLLSPATARRLDPPIPFERWALLGRAAGLTTAVERHLAEFDAVAWSAGAIEAWTVSDEEAGRLWRSYGERAAELRWSADALTCRLALPPAAVGPLCGRAGALGGGPSLWAHGTGTVFWSIPSGAGSAEMVLALRRLAEAAGGGMVVENWTTPLPDLDVWGRPAGPLDLMRALKAQYDPRGTINPGRFVGGI